MKRHHWKYHFQRRQITNSIENTKCRGRKLGLLPPPLPYLGVGNYCASQTLWWYPLLEQGLSTCKTKISWKLMQERRTGSPGKQIILYLLPSSPSKRRTTSTQLPWIRLSTNSTVWDCTYAGSLFKAKKYMHVLFFLNRRWENKLALIPSRCQSHCWKMFRHGAGEGIIRT